MNSPEGGKRSAPPLFQRRVADERGRAVLAAFPTCSSSRITNGNGPAPGCFSRYGCRVC